MIHIYQGVDIVGIPKLRKMLQKNSSFLDDAFTDKEREYCLAHKNHVQHLAGRLAAKEACMKALGTGLTPGSGGKALQDIEILNHPSGRPELLLKGWVARLCRKNQIIQKTVSISHSGDYAVATVIMLGNMV
ncbi:MAG: holo-[acyl-carrier-protein] synthase [Thermodesulfovibrio sp.]|nr:holo-[acyl-carrier-protein] synthase [Thermodesulfovibrio sp.]